MYEEKWTLSKKPFENDLDLSFFFEDAKHHKEAHVRLLYAAEQRKPLALLIGEGGVGKSYIAQTACAKLGERKNILTAYVSASGLEGNAFLRAVALAFGGKAAGTREEQAAELTAGLIKNAKKGHAVLFVDNVEAADHRLLDEVRHLLDQAGPDGRPLLTIVLVGHPRLRGSLKRRQSLVQRLEVGYELLPLEDEEARAYILHRLAQAGGAEDLFEDEALDAAVKNASGFPRLLNRICDLALLMGMIDNLDRIGAKQVEDASSELADLRAIGSGSKGGDRDRDGGRDRDRDSGRGGRGGRGRGKGRDRDRDDRDDEEGGRGRRRRGRGRGRGKGRDRDDRNDSNDSNEGEDDSSYDFDAEEYKDIESMNELIQGSLKTHSGSGRRRRAKSKRPERGDPLQYFGGKDDEDESASDDENGSDDESGERKGRGRRRRRRGGRGRGKGNGDEQNTDEQEGGDDFAAGLDESEERPVKKAEKADKPEKAEKAEKREPVKAAAGADKKESKPAAKAEEDDFGAGL